MGEHGCHGLLLLLALSSRHFRPTSAATRLLSRQSSCAALAAAAVLLPQHPRGLPGSRSRHGGCFLALWVPRGVPPSMALHGLPRLAAQPRIVGLGLGRGVGGGGEALMGVGGWDVRSVVWVRGGLLRGLRGGHRGV